MGSGQAWHAELAWLPGGVRRDVLIETDGDRFTAVTPGTPEAGLPPGTARLAGLTLPGLANAHSHAFHRALRGVTQAGRGTFWTWRERMYEVAGLLDPGSYLDLARAVYAEMALAGITCVGEFHYLHHDAGGARYADPNEMSRALIEAAAQAGIRICLLDTCYLSGGLSQDGEPLPLEGPQLRFGDGDAAAWAARLDALGADAQGVLGPHARLGAAIHSVRAVPPGQMSTVVAWARRHGAPLHAHLSEQQAENRACLAAYQHTPAEVLDQAGALGERSSLVHATHLTATDISLLGGSRSYACFCPTTEADLADGIGPAAALAAAGSPLTLGSDSQAIIDPFEEARRLELGERLATQERGHFTAADLATAATADGHASLGWPDAGQIAPGMLADLVTISLDTPRTAGAVGSAGVGAGGAAGVGAEGVAVGGAPTGADGGAYRGGVLESVIFGASAADVTSVISGGRQIVRDGRHLLVPDVPAALTRALTPLRP